MRQPNRIQLMRRFVRDDEHLARLLGVSEQTLYRWMHYHVAVPSAGLRLLTVLEDLEMAAPEVHAYLVDSTRDGS